MKVKLFFPLCIFIFGTLLLFQNSVSAQEGRDVVIGRTITINSRVLNENRDLQIFLPPGYNLTGDKFPVLYILDGENYFNYTASTVQLLGQMNVIPQMIVIGIPNVDRGRDFTPTKQAERPNSGGGEQFLKFLGDELFPYIEQNYRTQPYRILAGHSLCGMYAFYSLFTRPEYFNAYIGLSPWVIYDNNFMLDYAKKKLENKKSLNSIFYFSAGSLEANLLPAMSDFINILKSKAPKDFNWEYKLMKGDDHGSLVPMTIQDGLKYIYKGWAVPAEEQAKGIDAIVAHYKNLSKKYGYEVTIQENTLNNAGYTFLFAGNFEKAIGIFKKNIELHPKSANVYDSLGEAYERSGQMQLAKECYEKAYNIAKTEKHVLLETFKANFERASK